MGVAVLFAGAFGAGAASPSWPRAAVDPTAISAAAAHVTRTNAATFRLICLLLVSDTTCAVHAGTRRSPLRLQPGTGTRARDRVSCRDQAAARSSTAS